MNVLLISINRLRVPYPVYPLGLDHVAGAISAAHRVRILDLIACAPGAVGEVIAAAVREEVPDAVGISIRNIDDTDASSRQGFLGGMRAAMAAVRAACRAPIILGGAGYSLFPESLLEALAADYGVVGEGERLGRLLDAIERKEDPSDLPGVVVRGRKAVVPEPWSDAGRVVESRNPQLATYLSQGGMLNLQTKRGCPFRCLYCTYPAIEGRHLRLAPVEEVARTARRLQESGAKFLFIADSAFNASLEHSLQVAEAFSHAGLSIPWGAFLSPLPAPSGYYRALAEAGCTHIEFGTDALSDAMLERLRKPFSVAQAMESHATAVAAGLHVAHFLALGGPGESPHTVNETLDHAARMERAAIFFFCGLRIYRGTALFDLALAEGQIAAEDDLLTPVYYRPGAIGLEGILERVSRRAGDFPNWIVGSGGERVARLVERMHRRGQAGPLWERLIG